MHQAMKIPSAFTGLYNKGPLDGWRHAYLLFRIFTDISMTDLTMSLWAWMYHYYTQDTGGSEDKAGANSQFALMKTEGKKGLNTSFFLASSVIVSLSVGLLFSCISCLLQIYKISSIHFVFMPFAIFIAFCILAFLILSLQDEDILLYSSSVIWPSFHFLYDSD